MKEKTRFSKLVRLENTKSASNVSPIDVKSLQSKIKMKMKYVCAWSEKRKEKQKQTKKSH